MMHLPKVAEKCRPPRMLVTPYPLGHSFAHTPGDWERELEGVRVLLELAVKGGLEEVSIWQPKEKENT